MDARFTGLRAHADFARAMQDVERFAAQQGGQRRKGPRLALAVFVLAIAALLVRTGMQRDDLATGGIGVLLLLFAGWSFLRAKQADARPRPVVSAAPAVVVERYSEQVDTHRDNGKMRTVHYVKLRDEADRQQSYRVSAELYERLRDGAIGVAYPREKVLLDYRPFEI